MHCGQEKAEQTTLEGKDTITPQLSLGFEIEESTIILLNRTLDRTTSFHLLGRRECGYSWLSGQCKAG